MSKDEIINSQADQIESLKFENEQLRKLIGGSKSERFVPTEIDSSQGNLFIDEEQETVDSSVVETESITYKRKKPNTHPGRNKLPDHLPVEEVIIEPDEDVTGLKKIGEERTETLEYNPASLVKKITIRPKYAKADGQGVVVAPLPSRPIPKGIAEASLLAYIMVSKFIDHLPFYRQIQRFKRDYDWDLSSSTINDWFIACCTLLKPLYNEIKKQMLDSHYLQADESPIKVQDSDKTGATHQGYQWVYRDPLKKLVVFQYRKGRGMQGPKEMLSEYKGKYLQSDGYKVYDKIAKLHSFSQVGCWAHTRRKFFDAKDNDPTLSTYALSKIQEIYKLEKEWKALEVDQRKTFRQEKIKPILDEFKIWLNQKSLIVLPKSPIGKAFTYAQNQWEKLYRIIEDGRLEIDNNRIENKIRPLALGRKNYLFAGSHASAQRIAMMYTFFATCKAKEINPYAWLKQTLEVLPETKLSQLYTLVPGFVEEEKPENPN